MAEPARHLLNEKMLADRWVCSIARFQRWRSVVVGPQYLKIVGKVLYRLRDLEAYEEASLIRNWRMFFTFEGTDAVLVDYLDYH